jgi:hypothetical protein
MFNQMVPSLTDTVNFAPANVAFVHIPFIHIAFVHVALVHNPLANIALARAPWPFWRHALAALLTTVALRSNIAPSLHAYKGAFGFTKIKALWF